MVGSTGGPSRVDRFNQALQQPQVIDKIEFPPLLRSIDIYGMLISELQSETQTVAGEPLFNKYNKDASPRIWIYSMLEAIFEPTLLSCLDYLRG